MTNRRKLEKSGIAVIKGTVLLGATRPSKIKVLELVQEPSGSSFQ